MDENPDEINVAGDIIPFDDESYKNWAKSAVSRILTFSQMEPLRVTMGGMLLAELDLKGIVVPNSDGIGTTICIDPGIKKRGELVGMAGSFFHPFYIGVNGSDEAIRSWDWLFSQTGVSKEDLEVDLEFMMVLQLISTGRGEPTIFRILSLAADLKTLNDLGLDVKNKISELTEKIKGNVRSFQKLKDKKPANALHRISQLANYLSDLSAESRIARFAKINGMAVAIGKSPDLLIDDVRIEAKFDRSSDEMSDTGFDNKLKKGLNQGGEMIVILSGDLKKRQVKGLRLTWFPSGPLLESLITGIKTTKNGRKCVLVYTGTNKGYFGRLGLIR